MEAGDGLEVLQDWVESTDPVDSEETHHEAMLVDLHAHPTLKSAQFPFFLLFEPANRLRSPNRQPGIFLYDVFNPFKIRTAFPLLQLGGADILLSATVVEEEEMLGSAWPVKLINSLGRLLPIHWFRQKVRRTYFKQTLRQLNSIERAARRYNRFVDRHNSRPGLPAGAQRRKVEVALSQQHYKQLTSRSDQPIVLVHAIEGGHSLNGKAAGESVDKCFRFHLQSAEYARYATQHGEAAAQAEFSEYVDRYLELEQELVANLHALHARGVACITVAHFYPNYLCAPTYPYPAYAEFWLSLLGKDIGEARYTHDISLGLTPLGRAIVLEMFELGMLVDVTHCTPASRAAIYDLVDETEQGRGQVIATHVGAYAINPSPYNLEDWEIRWLAENDGLVGIIFMEYWLQPHNREQGLNFLSKNIEHVIKVGNTDPRDGGQDELGYDVVALGTDLDGFTDPTDEIPHYGLMPQLTERLMAEYESPKDRKYASASHPPHVVQKILGENAKLVLDDHWR